MKPQIFVSIQNSEQLTQQQNIDLKAAIENLIDIANRQNIKIEVVKNQ